MRTIIGILSAAILLAGCASPKSAGPKTDTAVITADFRPAGKVEMVDVPGRFVVISFEPGAVPKPGQRLNVYRAGAKVGEVKVTGPERDNNTVADILAGEVQIQDETREN
jgi:hypothetical protein